MQESDATNREIKELQQRNNELQRLVDALRSDCEELEEKHVIQTQKLREEMRALHNKHKQEAASLDSSHKVSDTWCVDLLYLHYIAYLDNGHIVGSQLHKSLLTAC